MNQRQEREGGVSGVTGVCRERTGTKSKAEARAADLYKIDLGGAVPS